MAGEDLVDPEPLLGEMLEEGMREVAAQYPEPRSSAHEERIETERRRLMRELRVLRRATKWAVPLDES